MSPDPDKPKKNLKTVICKIDRRDASPASFLIFDKVRGKSCFFGIIFD